MEGSTPAVRRFGFWSAAISAAASIAYSVFQLLQVAGVITYPWDEVLLFTPSFFIAAAFVPAMIALHHSVSESRRFWTHAGVVFAGMYATLAMFVYAVELAVAIPLTMRGMGDAVAFLSFSKNPFMSGVDALAYAFMSVSTFFASGALAGIGSPWLKRSFIAHGLLTPFVILPLFYPPFIVIGALWMITGPTALVLLSRAFSAEATIGR